MELKKQIVLRSDLTDSHYSQLFFIVGHIAIKMLKCDEQIQIELKQAFCKNSKKNSVKKEDSCAKAKVITDENQLNEVTGGKEAELDQYE